MPSFLSGPTRPCVLAQLTFDGSLRRLLPEFEKAQNTWRGAQIKMLSAKAQREEFDVMEMGASALLELAMGGIFTPMPKDAKPSAVEIISLENPKPSCTASASAPRQSRSTVLREDPAPTPKACVGTRLVLP
jgi:hypothetical protein